MTLIEQINILQKEYNIVSVIDLDEWHTLRPHQIKQWFKNTLEKVYKPVYNDNERIIFTLSKGEVYPNKNSPTGLILSQFQRRLNDADISNFFVILLTNDATMQKSYEENLEQISSDTVPINIMVYNKDITEKTIKDQYGMFNYNSSDPLKIHVSDLTYNHRQLLTTSKTFCMYPWVHVHAYPTGAAYPCCMSEMELPIGDMRKNTLKEIWNQTPIKNIRTSMLSNNEVAACTRCYEQEASGFFSGRQSANKHHGHHIARVDETKEDGTLDRFEMTYWDIRFSNLCNLSCRSCGSIFSSSWYQDQVALAGPEWAKNNKALNFAGRYKTDAWEQLLEHIDYVEQIYFAGGEPLMMEEHYNILDELERRGRFDVRLIYNTNFTQTKLKDREVFDYWRKFDSVSVGASLDAMGAHAEYIRKGTVWDTVERNRATMMEVCPKVDFYISPTLSIMNALHLPKFHKAWVDKGYIAPQDLNVNILQDPAHYRIDIANIKYKQRIRIVYEEHLEWLRPLDSINRATIGFESAINFMMATDNSNLIPKFWSLTHKLDAIRNENILATISELEALL
jgi:MoaA/NifB/PqqE/SkfB family radical SAM enzyme